MTDNLRGEQRDRNGRTVDGRPSKATDDRRERHGNARAQCRQEARRTHPDRKKGQGRSREAETEKAASERNEGNPVGRQQRQGDRPWGENR